MCIQFRSMRLLSTCRLRVAPAGSPRWPARRAGARRQPAATRSASQFPKVQLTAGRSTVLGTDFDITRIAITNPAIADAVVVAPREILIDGKAPGTVSLIVWGGASRMQYDLVVEQPVTTLEQHLRTLFPGEDITVSTNEGATILAGRVSSTKVMLRAAEIAAASTPKLQVINLLQVPGGSDSQQVMLQVRFAEVNRKKVTEAGLSVRAATELLRPIDDSAVCRAELRRREGRRAGVQRLPESVLLGSDDGIGGVLKALESTGGFQSLAEPNLIAYNGQEASFLAGGEFPIPVVSGATGTVSVIFKEFGIRLNFTPTIAGDAIRLKVRPEVSTLDFANGINLSGFRIPALRRDAPRPSSSCATGRRSRLPDCWTTLAERRRRDTDPRKLPIIGALFRSKTKRAEQTELMVLITPRLVRALDPDEVPPLPTTPEPFISRPGSEGAKPRADALGDRLEGRAGLVDAPPPATRRPSDKQ